MTKTIKKPINVGAVLYDPKVSVIWEIIADFFEENGCPIQMTFYSDYKLQVDALLDGEIEIAWNSPLAWLDAQARSNDRCRAIAMRDTDRNRVSHFIVNKEAGISYINDLKEKSIAFGALDSPQATLIPLGLLQRHGFEPGRDFDLRRFDVLVGKHGDHVGGELNAFQSLKAGEVAACSMLDLNWENWLSDGTIDQSRFKVLTSTDRFDHCVFTVREDYPVELEKAWLEVLFSMSYDNPKHREMMDLEGLREWLPGRTSGFGPLREAIARQGFPELS